MKTVSLVNARGGCEVHIRTKIQDTCRIISHRTQQMRRTTSSRSIQIEDRTVLQNESEIRAVVFFTDR